MTTTNYPGLLALATVEVDALRGLDAALAEQATALSRGDPPAILGAIAAARGWTQRLEALEQQRRQAAGGTAAPTLAAISAAAPEPYRSRAAALAAEAEALLGRIAAQRAGVEQLAAAGLAFADRYLQTLRRRPAAPAAYVGLTRPPAPGPSLLLDRQA